MRSAGCVINDFFDRDFDGNVERTKERPIAAGEISPNEALLLFFFLVLCSACLLLFMNLLTFLMALLGLGLATFYPISKRFFPIPQVFLGLAFSWGIIMVSSAQLGEINILSLALFLSCFFWIIAYDTAYALCDKKRRSRFRHTFISNYIWKKCHSLFLSSSFSFYNDIDFNSLFKKLSY